MKVFAKSVVLIMCLGFFVGLLSVTLTGCASTDTHQSTGEYIDDSAITTKVKAAFAKDPVVSAMRVHVTTIKGVVELTGSVSSETERNKADEIARGTAGVKSVTNKLVVKAK